MPSIKIKHNVAFYPGEKYVRCLDDDKEPIQKTITLGSETMYVNVISRQSYFVEDLKSKTNFMVNFEIWKTDKFFLGSIRLDDDIDMKIKKMFLHRLVEDNEHSFFITEKKGSRIMYSHNESGRTIWKICDCERIREDETNTRKKMKSKEREKNSTFHYHFEFNLKYKNKASDVFSVDEVKLQYFKPPPGDPDFKIICEDGRVLRFHKTYLSKISEPFRRMIENTSTLESANSEVKLKNVSFETLKSFYKILYGKSDSLKVEDLTTDLMIFADMYDIQFIYDYIRQLKTQKVTRESLITLCRLAQSKDDKYEEEAIFEFIKKNPGKLKHTEEWDEFLATNPDFAIKFTKRFTFSKE